MFTNRFEIEGCAAPATGTHVVYRGTTFALPRTATERGLSFPMQELPEISAALSRLAQEGDLQGGADLVEVLTEHGWGADEIEAAKLSDFFWEDYPGNPDF